MKAFPVVVLLLLAFAAFFLTFLVAPLAVLALFYVAFAYTSGRDEPAPPPAAAPEHQPPWQNGEAEGSPGDEPAAAAPARRARITVISRSDRLAAEQAAAEATAPAAPDGEATPVTGPAGGTTPATSSAT